MPHTAQDGYMIFEPLMTTEILGLGLDLHFAVWVSVYRARIWVRFGFRVRVKAILVINFRLFEVLQSRARFVEHHPRDTPVQRCCRVPASEARSVIPA